MDCAVGSFFVVSENQTRPNYWDMSEGGCVQIDIVQFQVSQALLHRLGDVGPAVLDLGSDKQLLSRRPTGFDGNPKLSLSPIGVGAIQMDEAFAKCRPQDADEFGVRRILGVALIPRRARPESELAKGV